jgi:hypothetical protein
MNPVLATIETMLLLLTIYFGALAWIHGLRRLRWLRPLPTVGWNQ